MQCNGLSVLTASFCQQSRVGSRNQSSREERFVMRFQKVTLAAIVALFMPLAWGQNFEITGQVGGQFNGGLDMSTSFFNRIEVGNGINYGVTAGYLLGEHYGVEFQWNHNQAETFAKSSGGP